MLPSPAHTNLLSDLVGRRAHLRDSNDGIVPAEIVRDAYSGNQAQADEYRRGTKDSPVDANEHGTEIPVAGRVNYLGIVHCSGDQDSCKTATCESSDGTIIA